MWNAGRGKLAGTPLPSLRGRWDSRSTRCGNSGGGGRSVVRRSSGMTLERLVLDYRTDELVVRCLYRSQDGLNPGTKARRKEVTELTRNGLRHALAALEAGAECVGTSGFNTREDVLLATTSPSEAKLVKGA